MSPLSTKEKIKLAAKKLISELGYKSASVRKIASDVGIRESALYNHYTNKEEIFLDILQDIFASPFSTSTQNVKEDALKGKLFLHRFVTQYKLVSFDKESEILFRILLLEIFSNKGLRERFFEDFHNKNIKVLSEAFFIMMQNNLIRSSDPMTMSYEFISTLFYIRFQITLLRFDSISTTNLSTQFEKHVDFFWEGIKV
ncbi:MAG: TetR/AcrR family transcriptional regulator [Epsilonproteobacteria bacterium]|nr:TetR/AcrR family transcriptional regulator [Campylobacterota bacterium]